MSEVKKNMGYLKEWKIALRKRPPAEIEPLKEIKPITVAEPKSFVFTKPDNFSVINIDKWSGLDDCIEEY